MMNNLFSVFDPASSHFSFTWILLPLILTLLPTLMWKSSSPMLKSNSFISQALLKEISFTMEKKKSQEILILTIFMMIVLMNLTALYPQVFSLSSHLYINLPLSLTLWMSVNLFGWIKNTKHMLVHLVPQGTPGALMMFMVLIELTSNIIRPITLCVRLTANMIAGHLLLTLLGNSLMTISKPVLLPLLIAPMVLSILETAVAIIQSYVFMTLISLYVAETK